MSASISGARIRKELSKHIPPHRITQSDAFRVVTVQPDNLQELHFIVGLAAQEKVPVVPAARGVRPPALEGWSIRLNFSRMSAITEFSEESGLVCAQAGTRIQDLADWLMDKGYTLMVRPDYGEDLELWEFLLSPDAGNFGPRYGCKWEQVFALTAVLPSGRLFENSLAPARATGPDFSRIILLGRGAFGIPLEVFFKVHPLPRRRHLTAFAISDLPAAVENAWSIAEHVKPEFMEIGINRVSAKPGVPKHFAIIELWGSAQDVTRRKERVKKLFGDSATPTDIAYEQLLGLEDTYQFDRQDLGQFFADRTAVASLVSDALDKGRQGNDILRLRGFAHQQACVTSNARRNRSTDADAEQNPMYASTDGEWLLRETARKLDPAGVFELVPTIWDKEE